MSTHSQDKDQVVMTEDRKLNSGEVRLDLLDGRLQDMIKECEPFYKNANLLKLYVMIAPGCLMAAVTLGFDSAMLNGLQAVPAWLNCMYRARVRSLLFENPIVC